MTLDLSAESDVGPIFDTGSDTPAPIDTSTTPDAVFELPAASCPGASGCACDKNADCDIDLCIDMPVGKRCATTCVNQCSDGLSCSPTQAGGGDPISVCVPTWGWLCDPCVDSKSCQALGHADARCAQYGDMGSYCGIACKLDADCGPGAGCMSVTTVEGQSAQQCARLPAAGKTGFGTCPCSARAAAKALSTSCLRTFDAPGGGGKVQCIGSRKCAAAGAKGLTPCAATPPVQEACDGVDNDCDGSVDEATCDDDNPCTKDACDPGAGGDGCSHDNEAGKPCDDGNKCTVDDTCKAGKCAGGTSVCVCQKHADCEPFEDGNLCNGTLRCDTKSVPFKCKVDAATVITCSNKDDTACAKNSCTPKTGKCAPKAVQNGLSCDDGDACTVGDQCKAGECTAGSSICGCKSNADCKDDGDLCNGIPICDKSKMPFQCKVDAKTVVTCKQDGGDPCKMSSCDKKSGKCAAVPVADGKACDDGNACTTADACKAGACKPGTSICGCESNADCAKQDDDNLCNGKLVCNKTKVPYTCQIDAKTVITCPTGGDSACAKNSCAAKTGLCTVKPVAEGKPCDDSDACTVGDQCKAGKCAAGTSLCQCKTNKDCAKQDDDNLCNGSLFCDNKALPYACKLDPKSVVKCSKDGNTECAFNACNPLNGKCAAVAAKNGTPCNDGSACTKADMCATGICIGTPLSCDDGNACTADYCAPKIGCKNVATSDKCDDGNACTLGDVCKATKCIPGPPPSCSDKKLNGNETAIDCGGKAGVCGFAACKPCGTGATCKVASDCSSKVCKGGKCAKATCSDKVKNGGEAGVDCGGTCVMCPRLFLLAGGAKVLAGVKEQGGAWKVQPLTGTTVSGVSLVVVQGKRVLGLVRYTKLKDPLDNALLFASWQTGKWADLAAVGNGITTRARPALTATGGVAHLAFHGMDYKHYHVTWGANSWSKTVQLGKTQAYGPSAPALATANGKVSAAWMNGAASNNLSTSELGVLSWGAPATLGDKTAFGTPPTLLSSGPGGELMALWARWDGQLISRSRKSGKWQAIQVIKDAWSKSRVTAALLADGTVQVAFRGQDSKLYTVRHNKGAWQAPKTVASKAPVIATTPALSRGIEGKEAEIAWVDGAGNIWHSRLKAAKWSKAVKVATGGQHVALVAGP